MISSVYLREKLIGLDPRSQILTQAASNPKPHIDCSLGLHRPDLTDLNWSHSG